jgi:quercetin dioxygenase-like cupin family protein
VLLETEVHERRSRDGGRQASTLRDFRSSAPVTLPQPQRRRGVPLRARRLSPLLLMSAGVAVFSVAALVLVPRLTTVPGGDGTATRERGPAPASTGVTISGPSDVAAQTASYAPGQSSGWHSHTGLHAVVVLSGTLTIVDGECRRQTYGPGDSYVGGRDVHLALNETAAPLEMAVTYMFPAGVPHTGFHVPAAEPAGCGSR